MTSEKVTQQSASERTLLESAFFYGSVLLRYKWLIVGITAAAAILVLVFSIVTLVLPPDKSPLPNRYRAQATLIVQEGQTGGLDSVVAALGLALPEQAEGAYGSLDYGQLALMVLNSRIILDPLVEEFDIINRYEITENVRTASRNAILYRAEFNYTRTTGVLTISYESIDPIYSRDMVNRMVELLNDGS